jgi:hypothetical protein
MEKHFEHVLNPFNGMHCGLNPDGTTNKYIAQVATIQKIVNFTPQDLSFKPGYPSGYIQMLYNQPVTQNLIQVEFSLPPNRDFNVVLSINTNVENSTFNFTIDGITQTKTAKMGSNPLPVTFKGNSVGQYSLIINPEYKLDSTTFVLSEIKIQTIDEY